MTVMIPESEKGDKGFFSQSVDRYLSAGWRMTPRFGVTRGILTYEWKNVYTKSFPIQDEPQMRL